MPKSDNRIFIYMPMAPRGEPLAYMFLVLSGQPISAISNPAVSVAAIEATSNTARCSATDGLRARQMLSPIRNPDMHTPSAATETVSISVVIVPLPVRPARMPLMKINGSTNDGR